MGKIVQAIVTGALIGGAAWYFLGGGAEKLVLNDALERYNIVRDPTDKCIQAGHVVAALLQLKDDKHYLAWKATESYWCTMSVHQKAQ